jgi:hypothetical protein
MAEDVTTEDGVTEETENTSVEETEEAEQPAKPASPRDQMMAEIVAKQKEQRKQDSGEQEQEEEEPEEKPEDEPQEEPEDDYLTLKVDGKEQRRRKQDVLDAGIKTLQKELAADKRLAEASQVQRDLEARARQIEERENALRQIEQQQQLSRQQQESQLAQKLEDQGHDNPLEEAKKTLAELYSGDDDEAAKALARFVEVTVKANQEKPQQVNLDEIAEKAYRRIREEDQQQRFQSELSEGLEEYQKDFSDVAQDPKLHNYANYLTDVLMKEHPEWGPKRIIREAAQRTRDLIPQPSKDVLEQRREKKRSIDNVEGAKARAPGKEPKKPKTPAEIVAEQQRLRGQIR